MKRLLTVWITILFLMTAIAAPASFAVENNQNTDDGHKVQQTKESQDDDEQQSDAEDREDTDEESDEDTDKAVTADTSWFDADDPKEAYSISTEAQLLGLASLVNEIQDQWKSARFETFQGVTFTLSKDIKLTQEWTPIGSGAVSYFAGVFDGDGHTISNLKLDSNSGNAGFFGYLTGEVRNLKISGEIKSADSNCGGMAGQISSSARVIDCTTEVKITGSDKVGGVVGYNDNGTIEGCINLGNVSGTIKVGGVVGENWGGIVSQCGNQGKVESNGRGVATYGTGGIAGRSVASTAVISECYNTGKIVSSTEATGGVVGYTNAKGSTISECYNTGNIKVKTIKDKEENLVQSAVGGVVGTVGVNGVIVSGCYHAAEITNADIVGGVIGRYIYSDYGYDKRRDKDISDNYYLLGTIKYGIGSDNGGSGIDIPQSTEGLSQGALTEMAAGLGAAYKNNDSGMYGNGGYPVLRWQEPVGSEEKVYMDAISQDVQEKLDRYLADTADKTSQGQIIMDIFNPDDVLSRSVVAYSQAKEKEAKKDKDK